MTVADDAVQRWALAYADLGARHVLEHYGRKIAGRLGRGQRHRDDKHRQVPTYNRHTVIAPPEDPAEIDTLISEGFTALPAEAACMRSAIHSYVRDRILRQREHDFAALCEVITTFGCEQDPHAA